MTIVLPEGFLFCGVKEGIICKHLLEGGHIDAIVRLSQSNAYGSSSLCVVILNNKRSSKDVFFIDASKDFVKGRMMNGLSSEHVQTIEADICQLLEGLTAGSEHGELIK